MKCEALTNKGIDCANKATYIHTYKGDDVAMLLKGKLKENNGNYTEYYCDIHKCIDCKLIEIKQDSPTISN